MRQVIIVILMFYMHFQMHIFHEVSDPIKIQRLTVTFNIIFQTKIIVRL